jgi:hypothetical protein
MNSIPTANVVITPPPVFDPGTAVSVPQNTTIFGVSPGDLGASYTTNIAPVIEAGFVEFNNLLNLSSLFNDLSANKSFQISDVIESLVLDIVPASVQTHGKQTDSTSVDTTTQTKGYVDTPDLRVNPANPSANIVAYPNNRSEQNIANEPTRKFQAMYPYNKATTSEGGHLFEVDDTPKNERILTRHITGTYDEMHADGSKVTKVVGDNYTIVAGDEHISVQGLATLHIQGDVNIRIGGHINIIADAGINISTKGDYRVLAKSINFESTSGDFTAKAAGNTTFTSDASHNVKSKNNLIDSEEITSINSGQQLIISSKKVSVDSATDIVLNSGASTYVSATGDMNVSAASKFAVSASSVEIDANLNVKQTTNMKAGATPVIGQGSAAASTSAADESVKPVESTGSGISYSSNPAMTIEENDDDPEAMAAALKRAIASGAISKDELNTHPGQATASDATGAGKRGNGITNSTIGNLGSSVPDNLRLTPHFTVGQLSKYTPAGSHIVRAQLGYSASQIVSNMQLLAINCLEPIKEHWPEMRVTSCFRTLNNGKSQHEKGMAADMQFASANRNPALYYEYAQWIKENIIFDQLLLEYKSTGTGLPWIHISFNPKGNRHQVLTLYNGATHSQGLSKLK